MRPGNGGSGGAEPNDSQSENETDEMWQTVLESRSKLNEVRRRFRNCQRTYIETGSTNGTKNNSRTNSITTNAHTDNSEDGDNKISAEQGNNDPAKKEDTFSAEDNTENAAEELVNVK